MTISLAVPDILVARAKSGDLEALEALYRAYETPVYNLALRVLRRPEDAEDVLQETILEVVRSIKQYRGAGSGRSPPRKLSCGAGMTGGGRRTSSTRNRRWVRAMWREGGR